MSLVSIPFPNFIPNTTIASAQTDQNNAAFLQYLNAGSGSFISTGFVVLPGAFYLQWGLQQNVLADGTAPTVIAFPTTFPTQCFQVWAGIDNDYQVNHANVYAPQTKPASNSISAFTLNVAGAISGGRVGIRYWAVGN